MSLTEAYTLAHTAQCRLQMETSRPQRNLRFVVGHLMHYESLRLRIVEIEHDISKHERARRRSQPQVPAATVSAEENFDDFDDDDDIDDEELIDDDENAADLSLERFPSGSARPPHPPPELEPDDSDEDEEDDEPVSPTEPDQATLQRTLQGDADASLTTMYNQMRACPCHGKTVSAPTFERMWQLPSTEQSSPGKEGMTRAVGQVEVAAG